jgi:hypothetical protein
VVVAHWALLVALVAVVQNQSMWVMQQLILAVVERLETHLLAELAVLVSL